MLCNGTGVLPHLKMGVTVMVFAAFRDSSPLTDFWGNGKPVRTEILSSACAREGEKGVMALRNFQDHVFLPNTPS